MPHGRVGRVWLSGCCLFVATLGILHMVGEYRSAGSRRAIEALVTRGNVADAAFDDSGRLAMITSRGRLEVWDPANAKSAAKFSMAEDEPGLMAVTRVGAIVAVGSASGPVRLYDTIEGTLLATLKGHSGRARVLRFSRDDARLASIGEDGLACVWNVEWGREIQEVQEPLATLALGEQAISAAAVSPDMKYFAVGNSGGHVKTWDFEAKKEYLRFPKHSAAITNLAFSDDGILLASADAIGAIRVWDLNARRRAHAFESGNTPITALAFHPNRMALAAGRSGEVRAWSLATNQVLVLRPQLHRGRALVTFAEIDALAYSPDGALLVAAGKSNPEVMVWNADSGKVHRILAP
jgi:WD40 repeat protein